MKNTVAGDAYINECIETLIELEPVFRKAGKLTLDMRKTAASRNKFNTGIHMVDIVTEADLAVQELILKAMAKTKMVDCQLAAEEDTPTVGQITGKNGLMLTIDPIDGTFIYASEGDYFSIILGLRQGAEFLYTFCYYPALNWGKRIIINKVESFGKGRKVKTNPGLDLANSVVSYTYGDLGVIPGDIRQKLDEEGFRFLNRSEITGESGSTTLLFLNQVAGFFVSNPLVYDGLTALHFGRAMNYRIYSDIDLDKIEKGAHGPYHPGWYLVLRK